MDSSNAPRTISLFSSFCKAGEHAPFIHQDEVSAVRGVCDKIGVSLITCCNPHKDEFLVEVDGLDFGTVRLNKGLGFDFPPFIPTISKGVKSIDPDLIKSDVVAVSIKDIVSKPHSSAGILKGVENFRIDEVFLSHRLFREKKVIVLMSGTDCLLEHTVWPNFERILEILSKHGIHAITGVNFSVINGECPFGQRLNQKRSLVSSEKTERAGMIPIPHIYAPNRFHQERYVKWLNDNPNVDVVTINGSLENENIEDMKAVKEAVAFILNGVNRKLHILLQGVSFRHFYDMCEFMPYLHFSLLSPSYNAVFRQESIYNPRNGKFNRVYSPLPVSEIFLKNLKAYEMACKGICPI